MNETFFEICFNQVSVLTVESSTEADSIFSDICKKYIEENLKNESTQNIVICTETPELIKKNHATFPHNTWYLVSSTEPPCFSLYYKNKIVNQGWMYNSESTKITNAGIFNIRKIKLGEKLINKLYEINQREDFATTQINEANLKCLSNIKKTIELNNRENDLKRRSKSLDDYANDLEKFSQQLTQTNKELIEWENILEAKENDLDEIINEKNEEIKRLTNKLTPQSYTVKKITPKSTQQPYLYLEELKDFFSTKHWRRYDNEDDYLQNLDSFKLKDE